jgi:probable phosphomutase (TIGR03848 family)
MPSVYLVRHAISQANIDGILAGRTPGVRLGDGAEEQLTQLREYFSTRSIDCVVSSPLLRAQLTAEAISMNIETDSNLDECHYGDWSNRPLSELSTEPMWQTIQTSPSQVKFPGGESISEMQNRAISAVEKWKNAANHSVLVTHGDVIKSIIAQYARLSLDEFQAIRVAPASVTTLIFSASHVQIDGVQYSSHGSEVGGGKRG